MTDTCTRCGQTVGYDCGCTEIERLTAERDRYKARAERAKESLGELHAVAKRAVRLSLDYSDFKLHAMEPMERAITHANSTLAQIDAEPTESDNMPDDFDNEAFTIAYLKGFADGKNEPRQPTVQEAARVLLGADMKPVRESISLSFSGHDRSAVLATFRSALRALAEGDSQ